MGLAHNELKTVLKCSKKPTPSPWLTVWDHRTRKRSLEQDPTFARDYRRLNSGSSEEFIISRIVVVQDLQGELLSLDDLDREIGDEIPFGIDRVVDSLGLDFAGA